MFTFTQKHAPRRLSARVLDPFRQVEREDKWENQLIAITAFGATAMLVLLRIWS